MCTCLSQVVLKAFKHLAHCQRTVSNDLLADIWLYIYGLNGCSYEKKNSSSHHNDDDDDDDDYDERIYSNKSIVYSGFFNLFSKQTLTHNIHIDRKRIRLSLCLTIFSTGIGELLRCALNTQFICSMKFISLWLFNGFSSLLCIFWFFFFFFLLFLCSCVRCYFRWNSGC